MSKRRMYLMDYVIAAPAWHRNGAWLKNSRMPRTGLVEINMLMRVLTMRVAHEHL
jgi:hypothetical protein